MSRGNGDHPRQEPGRAANRNSFAAMLKEQFRKLARSLTTSQAPAPQPTKRRRRTEDTGQAVFRMAAKKIMRRTVRLPAAAYAAVSYLADALEWFDHELADMDEDMQPGEQHHLSLHL